MKKFVCTVCGYVYEGEAAPEKCPVCGVGADKFKEQTGERSPGESWGLCGSKECAWLCESADKVLQQRRL